MRREVDVLPSGRVVFKHLHRNLQPTTSQLTILRVQSFPHFVMIKSDLIDPTRKTPAAQKDPTNGSRGQSHQPGQIDPISQTTALYNEACQNQRPPPRRSLSPPLLPTYIPLPVRVDAAIFQLLLGSGSFTSDQEPSIDETPP